MPTPDWVAFSESALRELGAGNALGAIVHRLEFPLVVKPASHGSALGIKFARSAADVPTALVAALSYDTRCCSSVMSKAASWRSPSSGVPAMSRRRCRSSRRSARSGLLRLRGALRHRRHHVRVPGAARCTARRARPGDRPRRVLGPRLYGFARVDMILAHDSEPQILELNPIPGLTETSLLPQAADAAGIEFDQLVERILESARMRSPQAR